MIDSLIKAWWDILHLDAVTADGLVTRSGVDASRHVRGRRHQQTVDFVRVTIKHCYALHVLEEETNDSNLYLFNFL